MPGYDHLGNAVPVIDDKRDIGVVYQNDLDLSPVIRVNSARRIKDADASLCGKPASGAHLSLESHRKRDPQASGHKSPLMGLQCHCLAITKTGAEICACRLAGAVDRKSGSIRNQLYLKLHK